MRNFIQQLNRRFSGDEFNHGSMPLRPWENCRSIAFAHPTTVGESTADHKAEDENR